MRAVVAVGTENAGGAVRSGKNRIFVFRLARYARTFFFFSFLDTTTAANTN